MLSTVLKPNCGASATTIHKLL